MIPTLNAACASAVDRSKSGTYSARLLAAFEAPPRTFFDDGDAGATQCWNQSPVDGRPGISSNSSVSLKSNSFSMFLEPLILAS